ncbi:guanylate kinase, partial [bacterium]|nr:guanylate kinase [bacterium]
MQGRLFLISSSSGAGKTSLAKSLVQKIGAKCNIERVVTYTTRPQGKSEVHGKDYHFLSDAQFEKGEQDGLFLEWSTSYEHVYASPASI